MDVFIHVLLGLSGAVCATTCILRLLFFFFIILVAFWLLCISKGVEISEILS